MVLRNFVIRELPCWFCSKMLTVLPVLLLMCSLASAMHVSSECPHSGSQLLVDKAKSLELL